MNSAIWPLICEHRVMMDNKTEKICRDLSIFHIFLIEFLAYHLLSEEEKIYSCVFEHWPNTNIFRLATSFSLFEGKFVLKRGNRSNLNKSAKNSLENWKKISLATIQSRGILDFYGEECSIWRRSPPELASLYIRNMLTYCYRINTKILPRKSKKQKQKQTTNFGKF